MNIVNLFLKINITGIITFSELDWITNQQLKFSRIEESIALKLGRMIDSGDIYWLSFNCIKNFIPIK